MVEVALMLPFLLLLLLGVIEIGRYAYASMLVGSAARAGAAYGSYQLANAGVPTGQTVSPGIQQAAQNDYQSNGQNISTLTVTSTIQCGCDVGGVVTPNTFAACYPTTIPTCAGHWVDTVSVTASGQFTALFNYPGIPPSLTVTRTSTMRVADR